MGGIWNLSVSGALENMPVEARGIGSGVIQSGYALGYLLISCGNLAIGADTPEWRYLFYVAATVSFLAAAFRLALPESKFFLDRRAVEKESGVVVKGKTMTFLREGVKAIRFHWRRCVYAVIYLAAFK